MLEVRVSLRQVGDRVEVLVVLGVASGAKGHTTVRLSGKLVLLVLLHDVELLANVINQVTVLRHVQSLLDRSL